MREQDISYIRDNSDRYRRLELSIDKDEAIERMRVGLLPTTAFTPTGDNAGSQAIYIIGHIRGNLYQLIDDLTFMSTYRAAKARLEEGKEEQKREVPGL